MKPSLLSQLSQRILVANGAMGTELAARGLKLNNSSLANVEHPEIVKQIFKDYLQAGALVFQSNTFAANEAMLQQAGLADRHDEINRQGMQIARAAIGDEAYLAANLGPTGLIMEPYGTAKKEQIIEIFARQARILLSEGPDFVLLETFEALEELEAAVEGVRAAGLNVPLALTFSFSQPSGRSMMGVTPRQAAEKMLELGAEIIGANCGLPENTIAALREMASISGKPLMIQANAGVPELRGGETCFLGTPEEAAALAQEAALLGARIIGGCCGTGPEHIRAIVEAIGNLEK